MTTDNFEAMMESGDPKYRDELKAGSDAILALKGITEHVEWVKVSKEYQLDQGEVSLFRPKRQPGGTR